MRLTKDGRILTKPLLVAIAAAALVLPGCGKKKGDDAATSTSKGSPTAGSGSPKGAGSDGTTKAPTPAPADPAPTAPPPPADYFKVKAAHTDASKGPFELQFGTWSVVKASFDPANLEGATAELEIDMASVSTGNASRDASLKSMNYFDVQKYPKATVKVDNVKKSGDTRYTADAEVKIYGNEKKMPFTLDVVASAADRVTVKVSLPFSRHDFSVGPKEADAPYAAEVVVDAVVTLKKP